MYKKLLIFLLFFSTGCAGLGGASGGMNSSVRDYESLVAVSQTKLVSYNCDFSKIAKQEFTKSGDYCGKPENEDYVSFMTSFDIQSTNMFTVYLSEVTGSYKEGDNSFHQYYKIYAANKADMLAKHYQLTPPTSFAVQRPDSFRLLGLTKKDLMARMVIEPTLAIRSIKVEGTPSFISDYTVKFDIMPYSFENYYTSPAMGRMLGLPAQEIFEPYGANAAILAERYGAELQNFWENPSRYRSMNKVTAMDYALPQVGRNKFNSKIFMPYQVTPPFEEEEGLLVDYLPAYELQSIVIKADEGVIKEYGRQELMKLIMSFNDTDTLMFKYNTISPVILRYIYKAQKPIIPFLRDDLSNELGIGYIYSDIAETIVVDLFVDKYYDLTELPMACIDSDNLKILNAENNPALVAYLDELSVYNTKCSYNQKSIIENLGKIFK